VTGRAILALLLLAGPAAAAQAPQGSPGAKVIDLRAVRPPSGNTFEAVWSAYKKAAQKGDAAGAQNALKELRRLRTERNVRSLETFGLARVSEGLGELEKGEGQKAADDFREAVALDPYLPDGYLGQAQVEMKDMPLGVVPGVRYTVTGTLARSGTARGRDHARALLVPAGLLAAFGAGLVFALAMVLRHGALLLHDIEEAIGPGRRSVAVALYALVLLLPVITFQGYGWLPLWWLALLFGYLGWTERGVTAVMLLVFVSVGPVVGALETRLVTQDNPLYRASLLAVEGGPDSRAISELEQAQRVHPDDRDLVFLLAAQYKKAGRYDDGAALYRDILRGEPNHAPTLNNLANLEFAAGEFKAAIARYKQAIENNPPAPVAATLYYNLSLAHLQLFEFQPAQEARSQAERLNSTLMHTYDALWKYADKNEYAVVDLNLTAEEAYVKYAGLRQGIREKNLMGTSPGAPGINLRADLVNRFTAAPLLLALVAFAVKRWRGARMFTMKCVKCGTPFCRRCHLGTAAGGLCTQCHHLFVVRDGVSGPARNQKLLEVQKEDERRERVFRALSLVAPGAGHLYAHKTLSGMVFVLLWSAVLAVAVLAGRLLPVTEASRTLSPTWGLWVGGVVLLAVYVAANRARPDFDVLIPARRGASVTARRRAS
jgi:tetratricopeptide (TPR) repeat protein